MAVTLTTTYGEKKVNDGSGNLCKCFGARNGESGGDGDDGGETL